jgi:putative tricarboxylic transport membrane protein
MDSNKKEQISSIFLLLFSAFICFFSYQISIGSLRSPGSGFFPFFLAAILGLLSIMNFSKAILRRRRAVGKEKTLENGINWKNIILVLVGLFLYPILLSLLGFLLVTFIFTAFFLRFIEPQKWPVVLGMGGGIAIIFYLIFQYWLKIQFPSGIFGI